MKKFGVSILGSGTVGGGTYKILSENRDRIKNQYGVDVYVAAVLDKDTSKLDALNIPEELRAKDIFEIVSNPDVDVVCELIGGVGIAKTFVETALKAGKTVVSANKELIAKEFAQLNTLAKDSRAGLYYEASCVGGTPVIRVLNDSMQGNLITEIEGIVNGTTNYILSKMSQDGVSYDEALKEAQNLGFAEANPSADVDGFDAGYKLAILSSLAFKGEIPHDKVFKEGISQIKKEDIAFGKELGFTLKLLAIGKRKGNTVEARVHPAFVKNSDALAHISGSFNALKINGDNVGEITLVGKGAGSLPTGSAVVSDVIYATKFIEGCDHYYITDQQAWKSTNLKIATDFKSRYYLRLTVADKAGVLAEIGKVFAKNKVSICEIIQKSGNKEGIVPMILTTHLTKESDVKKALEEIKHLEEVENVEAIIRIA